MDIVVSKFGGTSVATSAKLQQIQAILAQDPRRRCVVVSAPGKAPGENVKVTDMLIELTNQALAGAEVAPALERLRTRFHNIYAPLAVAAATIDTVLFEFETRLQTDCSDARKFRDRIVASGEDINAQLFANYLQLCGVDAEYVSPATAGMLVSDSFGDARLLPEAAALLAKLRQRCEAKVVIFPGFFGITRDGDIATFSRGGSDLTGAILAEAVDAVEYENWTDVDGIYSANPNLIVQPYQIPALTYREMRELSYIGFGVFHEEAVAPVLAKNIPIRLRNTNNLANNGTLIVTERLPSERDVIGIASGEPFCTFTLQKFLMNREKGFGRRLLEIFEDLDLSYEHCPSGVDNISVIVDQTQLKAESVNRVIRAIEDKLQPDELRTEFDLALVSVVGEGLIHKIGVLSQAATALSRAGVNIKMVNQGSSEISIIFGINAADEQAAVSALYAEFFSA